LHCHQPPTNVFRGHPKLLPPGSVQQNAVYAPQHLLPGGQVEHVRRSNPSALTGRAA